jgi:hypothetical protein
VLVFVIVIVIERLDQCIATSDRIAPTGVSRIKLNGEWPLDYDYEKVLAAFTLNSSHLEQPIEEGSPTRDDDHLVISNLKTVRMSKTRCHFAIAGIIEEDYNDLKGACGGSRRLRMGNPGKLLFGGVAIMKIVKMCLVLSLCLNGVLVALLLLSVTDNEPPLRFDGTCIYETTDWTTIENVFKHMPFEIRGAGANHSGGASIKLANNIILLAKEPNLNALYELVKACPNKQIAFVME